MHISNGKAYVHTEIQFVVNRSGLELLQDGKLVEVTKVSLLKYQDRPELNARFNIPADSL